MIYLAVSFGEPERNATLLTTLFSYLKESSAHCIAAIVHIFSLT